MNPVAVITGASSGIGEVFARKLAARGYDLLLVARRQERLEALARELGGEVLAADLSTDAGMTAVAERLRDEPNLELLVNNAGFGTVGLFWEASLESQETMHRLHVMATVRLTHAALANMVPKNRGAVISVASVAGFARSAGNVSYCATKTWMNAFTEGLHIELRKTGSAVNVQTLCPGFTYTEFHEVMGVRREIIPKWLWMSADYVVDESLKGLDSGRWLVIPARKYRWSMAVFTRLPVAVRTWLEQKSPHKRTER